MDRSKKRGVERWIGRSRNKSARKKNNVHRENDQVPNNQPRREPLWDFRGATPPPSHSFIEDCRRRHDYREQIELTGADESSDGRGHEQEKRGAKKTLGGERGDTRC
jgi:hypothetical protein